MTLLRLLEINDGAAVEPLGNSRATRDARERSGARRAFAPLEVRCRRTATSMRRRHDMIGAERAWLARAGEDSRMVVGALRTLAALVLADDEEATAAMRAAASAKAACALFRASDARGWPETQRQQQLRARSALSCRRAAARAPTTRLPSAKPRGARCRRRCARIHGDALEPRAAHARAAPTPNAGEARCRSPYAQGDVVSEWTMRL